MVKETINASTIEKAKQIKLLICDVDGVLSDGKVYYSNQGDEIKTFNIKDGLGIKQLINNGIEVAIITGRESKIVARRARELGIRFIYQGKSDKKLAYQEIISQLDIQKNQVAHVGDDLPDLPLMKQSGLGICVADGHEYVRQNADWVTNSCGGQGVIREISDQLLLSQGKLGTILKGYLS